VSKDLAEATINQEGLVPEWSFYDMQVAIFCSETQRSIGSINRNTKAGLSPNLLAPCRRVRDGWTAEKLALFCQKYHAQTPYRLAHGEW
jgi:hypothetical protein